MEKLYMNVVWSNGDREKFLLKNDQILETTAPVDLFKGTLYVGVNSMGTQLNMSHAREAWLEIHD